MVVSPQLTVEWRTSSIAQHVPSIKRLVRIVISTSCLKPTAWHPVGKCNTDNKTYTSMLISWTLCQIVNVLFWWLFILIQRYTATGMHSVNTSNWHIGSSKYSNLNLNLNDCTAYWCCHQNLDHNCMFTRIIIRQSWVGTVTFVLHLKYCVP